MFGRARRARPNPSELSAAAPGRRRDLWADDPPSDARGAAANPQSPSGSASNASPPQPEYEGPDTSADEPMIKVLSGWLVKLHASSKGSSRRFFRFDEQRGVLAYAKRPTSAPKDKPSANWPIADVTEIEAVAGSPCAFKISCASRQLTVAASSTEERRLWMKQLQLRVEMWRERQQVPPDPEISLLRL